MPKYHLSKIRKGTDPLIELLPLSREDFPVIVEWNRETSPEFLTQWAGPVFSYPLTEEQLADFWASEKEKKDLSMYFYKIADSDTGHMIGVVELGKIDQQNHQARIGRFLINKQARGKGIAGIVLDKLFEFGFSDLGLHKITLGVFEFNKAAIAAYEKAGMKKDGLLRDHRRVGDKYWNLYEMSILENEWRGNNGEAE